MNKELYPAPIDNKNVLTDFTEVFHSGDCLTRKGRYGNVIEYFVVEDCLCSVSYVFGASVFHVHVHFGIEQNKDKANHYIHECIKQLYHDNVTQELIVRQVRYCTYQFFFKLT